MQIKHLFLIFRKRLTLFWFKNCCNPLYINLFIMVSLPLHPSFPPSPPPPKKKVNFKTP